MKLGGWQEVKKKKNGFSFFCFDCFLFFFFFLFLIKNIQIYFRQFTRHSVDRVIGSAGASHPHKHGSDVGVYVKSAFIWTTRANLFHRCIDYVWTLLFSFFTLSSLCPLHDLLCCVHRDKSSTWVHQKEQYICVYTLQRWNDILYLKENGGVKSFSLNQGFHQNVGPPVE